MQPDSLISICIPTCNRPRMLRDAIDSCLAQTYTNFELVIGDDSRDDLSTKVVEQYQAGFPGLIRYRRSQPPLGQNRNVNVLLSEAKGDRLVLLHDDDMLLPNALELLTSCWQRVPTLCAAFGKQYLVNEYGAVLRDQSEELNIKYFRTAEKQGLQVPASIPGVLRMFPNNGFMVQTELARQTGYRSQLEVGDVCDFDFGLRFCLAATHVWFLDEYVAKYRLSAGQLSKTALLAPKTYQLLENTQVPADALSAKRAALIKLAPAAASGFAKTGNPGKALSVLLSANYSMRDKLRLRALYHAFLIAVSFVRQVARRGDQ